MKWIDDHDDYFLRDFNDKSGDNRSDDNSNESAGTGSTDPTGTQGSAPASSSDNTAEGSRPSGNEFSFGNNAGNGSSSPTAGTNANTDSQETPRRKRRRARRRLIWFFVILFAILGTAFYIRYFVPYTSDTLTSGYITLVEKRGIFFKTFEGEMISESHLNDTSQIYSRDFFFSIPNDSLGRLVQSYQGTGKRVTLTTQKYYGTLPWRGSQKIIVTNVTAQ